MSVGNSNGPPGPEKPKNTSDPIPTHKVQPENLRNARPSEPLTTEGLSDLQLRIFRDTPATQQRLYLKSIRGEATARQAIKAKCHDCTGGMRDEIKHCEMTHCPLWPLRPYVRKPMEEQKR